MAAITGLIARAGMKTVEQFERLKQETEKSFGIEVLVDDPILKEVQNFSVEEEDVLMQIQKLSNEFIDSVTSYSKRDHSELIGCMKTLVDGRGTSAQKYRIISQLEEYKAITEETSSGEDSIASWLVLELQMNVLNPIDKQLKKNEELREQFWKLRELRRQVANLSKIASLDKKSKAELITTQKDCAELEQELEDHHRVMKDSGVAVIDSIFNEYCRIEAEYFSRMNDAYLEPSTPKPIAVKVGDAKQGPKVKLSSPVIGGESDDNDQDE